MRLGKWKNLKVGQKIGVGFGIVLLLLVTAGLLTFIGIGGIVGNAELVIEGNKLDGQLAQKEVDHLNWVNKVSSLLTDENVTELTVQTDDHLCGFGKWLYGQGRKDAEELVPSLATMLKEIEEPHEMLHSSAIEIKEHFHQADSALPSIITGRQVDHLNWADAIRDTFLQNKKELNVQTDPTKCALGKWINSEQAKKAYENGDSDFKQIWDKMIHIHSELHESAIQIKQEYAQIHPGLEQLLLKRLLDHKNWTQNVSQAIITGDSNLKVETDHTKCAYGKFISSQECADYMSNFPEFEAQIEASKEPHLHLHESAIEISKALASDSQGKAEAEKIFQEKTLSALDKIANCFHNAIEAENKLNQSQISAKNIFDEKTMPLLHSTLGYLVNLKQKAENELEGMTKAQDTYATKTVPALQHVQKLLGDIRKEAKKNVMTDEQMLSAAGGTKRNSNIISIVAAIIGILCAFAITIGITKPIKKGVNFAQTLAQGDLTQTLEIDQEDEIGNLINSFNEMGISLRESFKKVTTGVQTLSSSSTELASVSEQMRTNTEQTATKSNSVASASEEMSNNMNAVATAMEQASTNIKTVASAAEEMTSTINEIASNTERASTVTSQAVNEAKSASDKIDTLGIAANEISKVTETITEISEQTNLLALNATIEAARAGDAGKGFAVVANEIKDLANQTAEATEEIRGKVEGIQSSTSDTVAEIEKITKIINDVNEIVSSIASAIEEQSSTTKEIASNVNQAASGIQEVNENVAQTSAVSSEIAKDVADVNQTSNDMSNGASQVSTSSKELSELAEQLNSLVAKFKV